jgi:hypothetical protein
MKVVAIGMIIFILIMSSIAITPLTTLHASSKGLKLYLKVDTNQASQGANIDTYQYGNQVYGHNGFVNTGINEFTLEYPSRLIDTRNFRIRVTLDNGYTIVVMGSIQKRKDQKVYLLT